MKKKPGPPGLTGFEFAEEWQQQQWQQEAWKQEVDADQHWPAGTQTDMQGNQQNGEKEKQKKNKRNNNRKQKQQYVKITRGKTIGEHIGNATEGNNKKKNQ